MYYEIFKVVEQGGSVLSILMLIFIVSLIGALIGGITGLGGGMIIKPLYGSLLGMYTVIGNLVSKLMSSSVVLGMSLKNTQFYIKQNFTFNYKLGFRLGFGIIVGILLVDLIPSVDYGVEILLQGILYVLVFFSVLYRKKLVSFDYSNSAFISVIIGIIIGLLSSFFGIGGGAIKIPFFIVFFAMNIKEAAVYSFFAAMISEPVKLLQYSNEIMEVDPSGSAIKIGLLASLIAVIAALIGGFFGVRIQHKSSEAFVAKVFNIVILYFAIESIMNGILMLVFNFERPISLIGNVFFN